MSLWKNDAELFAIARRELFTCVVGDAMDKLGLHHQFLSLQIRPLKPEMVLMGRAMPVLAMDVFTEKAASANFLSGKPFGLMLEALDDLRAGEIYVCSCSSPRCALWGELMTTRAQKLSAAGAVLNGYVRDTASVLDLDFPIFTWGSFGQDSAPRLKIVDYRVPIEIDSVRLEPGDIVFGDIDGICIVPQRVENEVFTRAIEKSRKEKTVKTALQEGMSTVEAFRKYAVM